LAQSSIDGCAGVSGRQYIERSNERQREIERSRGDCMTAKEMRKGKNGKIDPILNVKELVDLQMKRQDDRIP
jgi:hypothetical protein